MKKKKQINEIYITRALAILGVLIVHSTSTSIGELDTGSSVYGIYNFTNIFFKFGTPTFIFLSSFVLFYNYYHKNITKDLLIKFYKNRLLYILIPYFIFSLGYYWFLYQPYFPYMTTEEIIENFISKLLMGKAAYHLYFVFISIQLYLLFPFLLLLFKKVKGLGRHAVWIGFVIQWGFVLLNREYFHITLKGSISLSYMAYYFLGIFVGIYYNQIIEFFNFKKKRLFSKAGLAAAAIWGLWIISASSYVYLWYWTRVTGNWADSLLYELTWNMHTYLSAIILMQVSYIIFAKFPTWMTNRLIHLGVVSFGIYLIHVFLLDFFRAWLPQTGNPIFYHFKILALFLLVLFFSWMIVGIAVRSSKYAWILFGATPKNMPYKQKEKQAESNIHLEGKKSYTIGR
ncbi:acyltransferase [Bacillus taeanensis]|uniref:Acyltransferase n=1 Tax=Bacillus taeanensis TaxID=273032 RepID=A0A366XXT0_9BACI|nr:acyltransferase [Bacillus taeanensis]RBW70707.1 acyltransferase [Bacillus taeanensis]